MATKAAATVCLALLLVIAGAAATPTGKKGPPEENSFTNKILNNTRQRGRAVQLLEDLKDASKGAYVAFLSPYHDTILRSWSRFQPRLVKLKRQAGAAFDATASRAQAVHQAALSHTKALVASLNGNVLPQDTVSIVILANAYFVVLALAAKAAWMFLCNFLYA